MHSWNWDGERIARRLYLFFLFTFPFFVIPVSWGSPDQDKTILASLCALGMFCAYLFARLSERSLTLPRNVLFWSAALVPASYLVSALFSGAGMTAFVSGSGAQDTVCAMSALFLLFAFSALLQGRSARGVFQSVRVLLLGAMVVVAYQLLELFWPSLLSLGGAVSGPGIGIFGSWHDLGILVAVVTFFCAVLWNEPSFSRGWWKWGTVALGSFSFLLLLIIGFADVWYGLAALCVLYAIHQWHSDAGRDRGRFRLSYNVRVLLVGAVVAVACGLGSGIIFSHVPARLQVTHAEVHPSWQSTFTAAGGEFSSARGWLFGTGPHSFTQEWDLFKPVAINQSDFWSVDFSGGVGFVPTAFATMGLVGLLAWAAFLLALIYSAARFVLRSQPGAERALPAALACAVLYLAYEHIAYAPGFGVSALFLILVGALAAFEIAEAPRAFQFELYAHSRRGAIAIATLAITSAFFIVACFSLVRVTVSDLLVARSASVYSATADLAKARAIVQEALFIYPDNANAERAAVQIGILQLQQLFAASGGGSTTALQSALSDTIKHGLSAVSIDPSDYQNWLSLAELYQSLGGEGIKGAYSYAAAAFQNATKRNPTSPLPLLGEAQVSLAEQDPTAALSYVNQAIALKGNLAASYYLRSRIELGQQQYEVAVQDAAQATQLDPQDPLGWYNLGSILYASAHYQDAVQALKQATSLQNNYANALFVLALCYDKLGQKADALRTMQSVASTNPADPTVQVVLKNLQSGLSALATSTPQKAK